MFTCLEWQCLPSYIWLNPFNYAIKWFISNEMALQPKYVCYYVWSWNSFHVLFIYPSIHSFMLLLFFVIIFYLYVTSFVQMSETVETCRVHWESEWVREWMSVRTKSDCIDTWRNHSASVQSLLKLRLRLVHNWRLNFQPWNNCRVSDERFTDLSGHGTARHGKAPHHTAHLYRLNLNLNSNL